jgi:hypothetical protein
MNAADFSLSTMLGSWTYNTENFVWLGNGIAFVHVPQQTATSTTSLSFHDTNVRSTPRFAPLPRPAACARCHV